MRNSDGKIVADEDNNEQWSSFYRDNLSKPQLGRVVRKPVNVNPGLNVNWSIMFST